MRRGGSKALYVWESSEPPAGARASRLLFIDNLRWATIALVVAIHSAVTYSGIGIWYYTENDAASLGPYTALAFIFFETHVQAFFMGLLFLIAGYFTPGSFDRKGARRFLLDRAVRLGAPGKPGTFAPSPPATRKNIGVISSANWRSTLFAGSAAEPSSSSISPCGRDSS